MDERLVGTRFGPVRWFERLDSTNRYLLDEAAAGAPAGTVAVADEQDAGRGRRDRRWESSPGGALLVSVLIRPAELPRDAWHLATAATALAMSDALEATAGFRPLLKWPNDLVVDDRKLAGVLAESLLTGPGSPALVVGVGCNLTRDAFPPELAERATSVEHVSGEDTSSVNDRSSVNMVSAEDLLVDFLDALHEHHAGLETRIGRAELRRLERERSATLGRTVSVETTEGEFRGTAVDLDPDGALVVDVDGATSECPRGRCRAPRDLASRKVAGRRLLDHGSGVVQDQLGEARRGQAFA